MNEDAQRRINEAVAKAKNLMIDATRIANNELLSRKFWKKLNRMTWKIEELQGKMLRTK
jgi:hypothetical protein